MKNLRRNFERLCYNHRSSGVPNLMLWIAIGNLIVYFFSLVDRTNLLYTLLCFSRDRIFHGQVWRLFTYIFTYLLDARGFNLLLLLISLFCYYQIGRMLEQQWGTLRFNLYYLCGIVLMDIGALALNVQATTSYLNLTLFLAIATIVPDMRFLLFYIIPVKAKYFAWFYFAMTIYDLLRGILTMLAALRYTVYLGWLFPLIALANYFLFFGKDVMNVMPDFIRYHRPRRPSGPQPNPNWAKHYRSKTGEKPYRHKCTVCGRTDTDYPNLEFRYCSRCKGYHCYCMDHINNHVHIQ